MYKKNQKMSIASCAISHAIRFCSQLRSCHVSTKTFVSTIQTKILAKKSYHQFVNLIFLNMLPSCDPTQLISE